MAKTLIDYMSEEDFATYEALLKKANEAKAALPKKPRAPLTNEQKLEAAKKRAAKLQALVDKMLADQGE